MHVFRDSVSIRDAALAFPDPEVRWLIAQRIADLSDFGDVDLSDLMHVIVFGPADAVAALDAEVGFPVLTNRFDGIRFGEPGFTPSCDVLQAHAHWFELVFVISDDGFGLVVFIAKHPELDPELLSMCMQYATPAQEGVSP